MADPNNTEQKPATGIPGAYDTLKNTGLRIDAAVDAAVNGTANSATAGQQPAVANTPPADAALVEEAYARKQAREAAAMASTPANARDELDRLNGLYSSKGLTSEETQRRSKLFRALQTKTIDKVDINGDPLPEVKATGDKQASVLGPQYRNVYRAPNGVMHDIYGSDVAKDGVAFHGAPGLPVTGNTHPAFIGQAIPAEAGLVEYRIPAGNALQQRVQSRFSGAA